MFHVYFKYFINILCVHLWNKFLSKHYEQRCAFWIIFPISFILWLCAYVDRRTRNKSGNTNHYLERGKTNDEILIIIMQWCVHFRPPNDSFHIDVDFSVLSRLFVCHEKRENKRTNERTNNINFDRICSMYGKSSCIPKFKFWNIQFHAWYFHFSGIFGEKYLMLIMMIAIRLYCYCCCYYY